MDLFGTATWLQRRQASYKRASRRYADRMTGLLLEEIEQEASVLRSLSDKLLIEEHMNQTLKGISLSRTILPYAKVDDSVGLFHKNIKKAKGEMVHIDPEEIKVKFLREFKVEESMYEIKCSHWPLIMREKNLRQALKRFESQRSSFYIQECLLGRYNDKSNVEFERTKILYLSSLATLNAKQRLAVEQSMKRRVTLIEGGAGSGKTLVAANIACSMGRLRQRKVLICSPVQQTIDKSTRMISSTKCVKVVQLPAHYNKRPSAGQISLSRDDTELSHYSLDYAVARTILDDHLIKVSNYPREAAMLQKRKVLNAVTECSKWKRQAIERKILKAADVVCCTVLQAGHPNLRDINFDMVIIDDEQYVSEMDCLVPIMARGIKQVVLLSDLRRSFRFARSSLGPDRKLESKLMKAPKNVAGAGKRQDQGYGPLVQWDEDSDTNVKYQNADLTRGGLSLFERWLSLGVTSVDLKYQYRMHENLAMFVSHHYYQSRLQNDPKTNQLLYQQIYRDLSLADGRFSWLPRKSFMTAVIGTDPKSDLNLLMQRLVSRLLRDEKIDKSRVGIITNLHTQTPDKFEEIRICTVADFYGQEIDYMIVVAHLRPPIQRGQIPAMAKVNYLQNDDALNVAITRARFGLFIVTHLEKGPDSDQLRMPGGMLDCCASWNELIRYYSLNNLCSFWE